MEFRRVVKVVAFLAGTLACIQDGTSLVQAGSLSFEERIAARRAVEEVLDRHRAWPADNRFAKPALDETLPADVLGARVEDDLAKSLALEVWWNRGIDAADLQAEMDRMAASTKDPVRLREIFSALRDDPQRIAEAVARPALADRLLRNRYAFDPRFHGAVREQAERALGQGRPASWLRSIGGEYAETTYTTQNAGAGAPPERIAGRVRLEPGEAWERFIGRLAAGFQPSGSATGPGRRPGDRPDAARLFEDLPVGVAGRLQESEDAFHVTAVLDKRPGLVRVATTRWPKRPFDAWWGSVRATLVERDLATEGETPSIGLLTLPAITGLTCTDDTWSSVRSTWVPDQRDSFAAVWTGSEMIVWGGAGIAAGGLDTGGRYNPATDTWTATSTGAGAPSRRWGHTAVWTGSEMIVWGGADGAGQVNTGGRYAPATDSWIPTSTGANVASPRDGHTAVWTGAAMIIWGGNDQIGYLGTGARYAPASDTWAPVSGAGAPNARWLHTAVWTGSLMIVWGGWNDLSQFMNTGGRYNPATDSWSATATGANVPAAAGSHTAVWTGSRMIVWGGLGAVGYTATGGRYDPLADAWLPTSTGAGLPAARERHSAIWTGTAMIVWGGISNSAYVGTGGRYDPASDAWSPTSTQANAPAARAYHAAVWTGDEMIVWGGYHYDGADHILDNGARYLPSSDTWVPTVGYNDPRRSHSAVWTGSELLVWGGERLEPPAATVMLATGGRYTPATDTWMPVATGGGAPTARANHSAVWTGSEMIVWGGTTPTYTNTGGRYTPASDTWMATSTGANVPTGRAYHTAVWTGSGMIVWGGTNGTASQAGGSVYTPTNDTWTLVAAGPQGRYAHTAVWTGSEMIVWGGTYRAIGGSPVRLNSGSRYTPGSNSWTSTSTPAGVPAARESHTAVWTGSEMIVWGGSSGSAWLDTGGRYTPASDAWTPVSTAGAPAPRVYHQAVWSGTEMIVWGGSWNDGTLHLLSTGGRYSPADDTWMATSIGTGLPEARDTHTAAWTTAGMIVWGGRGGAGSLASGARYCAAACSSPPPSGSADLTAALEGTTAMISWPDLPGAAAWDVVRGGLGALRASDGDFTTATTGCLAEDSGGATVEDADIPPAGDGFWYLVRGVSCGGAGPYDTGNPSQQGNRDAEIAASPGACR